MNAAVTSQQSRSATTRLAARTPTSYHRSQIVSRRVETHGGDSDALLLFRRKTPNLPQHVWAIHLFSSLFRDILLARLQSEGFAAAPVRPAPVCVCRFKLKSLLHPVSFKRTQLSSGSIREKTNCFCTHIRV